MTQWRFKNGYVEFNHFRLETRPKALEALQMMDEGSALTADADIIAQASWAQWSDIGTMVDDLEIARSIYITAFAAVIRQWQQEQREAHIGHS